MLGRKSVHAQECVAGEFIGTDFAINEYLHAQAAGRRGERSTEQFIPVCRCQAPREEQDSALASLAVHSGRSPRASQTGDVVLCPTARGRIDWARYRGLLLRLPDRSWRTGVKCAWLDPAIPRPRHERGCCRARRGVHRYGQRYHRLPTLRSNDSSRWQDQPRPSCPPIRRSKTRSRSPWRSTWRISSLRTGADDPGKEFDIYEEDGDRSASSTRPTPGRIDILAISKDKKRLLVVELKRGRASDVVVGQVLRYMGYVKEQIAEDDQTVEGVIIALEDDQKMRWALTSVPIVTFYRYQISFKLVRGA